MFYTYFYFCKKYPNFVVQYIIRITYYNIFLINIGVVFQNKKKNYFSIFYGFSIIIFLLSVVQNSIFVQTFYDENICNSIHQFTFYYDRNDQMFERRTF